MDQQTPNVAADSSKNEIELEKLKIEREKLSVERFKTWFTGGSIVVSFLAALATIIIGIQSESQRAELEFNLKAAEIVTRFQNPDEMQGRAKILARLFPDRLPANFGNAFDPAQFRAGTDPSVKIDLLKLIIDKSDQKEEIIRTWKQLFPADTWINDLR